MGRSYTPKYRIEYRDNSKGVHSQTWNVESYGKATAENLECWRRIMNRAFDVGGINYSVSKMYGFIVHISSAVIIRQSDNEIVAKISAPMFEVI